MRRWRDQRHSRLSVAKSCNQAADLMAGKLAALSGLRSLRHLDLDLFGMREVFRGNAEAARGYLLDLVVERYMHRRSLDNGLRNSRTAARAGLQACSPCRRRYISGIDRLYAVHGGILATFTGVRTPTQHVHRCGDGLMRL